MAAPKSPNTGGKDHQWRDRPSLRRALPSQIVRIASLALVGALVSIPSASAEGQRSDLLDSDNLVSWVPIRIFQPTKSFRVLRMRGMDGAYASELTATPETE